LKILVPIDGSAHAEKALKYALDFCRKFDAKIVLLHVIPDYGFRHGIFGLGAKKFTHELKKLLEDEGKNILNKGVETAKADGLTVESMLEYGHPSETIIQVAEKIKASLIVIGSRGMGSAKSFLLGSISDKVSHHAPCPVLIVR
jgi:nucleotide-binding universal stress UspA family protein